MVRLGVHCLANYNNQNLSDNNLPKYLGSKFHISLNKPVKLCPSNEFFAKSGHTGARI